MLKKLIPTAVIGVALGVAGNALAQDDTLNFAIDKMSCREMLQMDGDGRLYTLLYFHGYASGRKADVTFERDKLAEISVQVIDTCIDDPNEMLLDVLLKARG